MFPTEVEGTQDYGVHGERLSRSPVTHKEPGGLGVLEFFCAIFPTPKLPSFL